MREGGAVGGSWCLVFGGVFFGCFVFLMGFCGLLP